MHSAIRRYRERKYKEKAKRFLHLQNKWCGDEREITAKDIGIRATTRKLCSSRCCGNPRRFWKSEKHTIQEKKQLDSLNTQMHELQNRENESGG